MYRAQELIQIQSKINMQMEKEQIHNAKVYTCNSKSNTCIHLNKETDEVITQHPTLR